jgi:hypothetical protein
MAETPWWQSVTLHSDIREGRVNESLYAANLGRAVADEGPDEYRKAEVFFAKTYLTLGLRDLLESVVRRLSGDAGQNAVVILQTSFGGGKTHSELAVYHLLEHPDDSLRVPQVVALLDAMGLDRPPAGRVAVLAGTSLDPLGRTTPDGVRIRTLWGEMAYQLGGATGYAMVADHDAKLVSPGSEVLTQLLASAGPCVILFDETLHYVDRAANQDGIERNLAAQSVAFLRELTDAVSATPGAMMVVSLTASRVEQLSARAMEWLASMNEQVIREAAKKTPIERTEIHEIVRQRLFEQVDADVAQAAAARYRQLYASLGNLPAQKTGEAYQRLLGRSYPFHPELVSLLYERWGSKPGFQLTRDTLRFLAFVLQNLWQRRTDADTDLIRCLDVDLGESSLRGMAREVSGDPAWETVIGTDVAAQAGAEPAKSQGIDLARGDGLRLAQGLATTVLLYSLSGGENPYAARDELRLTCARFDVEESLWDDVLKRFESQLFYYFYDTAQYRFRKEPNVLSLQRTYHANLSDSEVDAYADQTLLARGLGSEMVSAHSFAVSYHRVSEKADPADDDSLKLVVLNPTLSVQDGLVSASTREACLAILEKHGGSLRSYRNTLVFAVVDAPQAATARSLVADYLSWRRIQRNEADWDRIGGTQQAIVQESLSSTEGATLKALISAYAWALVPAENADGRLDLKAVKLGTYGPGKLVVRMVWERLTAEGQGQEILSSLTPETLLQRYGSQVWPPSEVWLTTQQLWQRFARQVGLPMMSGRTALTDTLVLGQHGGHFAIGNLADEGSPRDERDSYLALYYKASVLPPQVPAIGERWLLLRPHMYEEIINQPSQVSTNEVLEAIRALDGEGQAVRGEAVYNYVKKGKETIDEVSFVSAIEELKESGVTYRFTPSGPAAAIPASVKDILGGWIVIQQTPKTTEQGRTITVSGTLALADIGALFNGVLKPLNSQSPNELGISLTVVARYEKDPGAVLTALLADGFTKEKFPGLTMEDSTGRG